MTTNEALLRAVAEDDPRFRGGIVESEQGLSAAWPPPGRANSDIA